MIMLQIIIFSFNRALQLDTLLTSLVECWIVPDYCVDVLYNTTDEEYEEAYQKVRNKFVSYPITYHKESAVADKPQASMFLTWDNVKRYLKNPCLRYPKSNFRSLLLHIIKDNPFRHLMFMTDDAMFIKDVNIPKPIFQWMDERPCSRQFILRIGEGMNNQPKDIVRKEEGYLKWNMYDAPMMTNWGYNFSVDAHIYSRKFIVGILEQLWFVNPNTLEDPVCRTLRRKEMMGEAMAYVSPRVLSFPINMVQSVEQNETLGVDCKMLNQQYLAGYTMKYPIPEIITHFQVYPDYLRMFKGDEETKLSIK